MWILIAITVLLALFLVIKRQYTYWDNSGIPSLKATFPIGNLEKVIKNERSFGTAIYDIYKQSSEPLLGFYLFFRPAILVRDCELVKNILTKDFSYFQSRGVYIDQKRDPMSANLFSLEGEEWKKLRHQLTPAFTSGKLKEMFENIKFIGNQLVEHFEPLASCHSEIDVREFSSRFVADCLASIAFGQSNISSINDPKHEFRMIGKRLQDNKNYLSVFRQTAAFICPGYVKIKKLK